MIEINIDEALNALEKGKKVIVQMSKNANMYLSMHRKDYKHDKSVQSKENIKELYLRNNYKFYLENGNKAKN